MNALELYSLARVMFVSRPDCRLYVREAGGRDALRLYAEEAVGSFTYRAVVEVPVGVLYTDDEVSACALVKRLRIRVALGCSAERLRQSMREFVRQFTEATESPRQLADSTDVLAGLAGRRQA